MRKLFFPTFFVLFLALGYWVAIESWNGSVFVYLGERRAPAAVRSLKDYSAFDRKSLYKSIHNQLLAEARLDKRDGYVGVTLGHPLVKREQGAGEFACPVNGRSGVFDRIELTFMGTGISSSGEQPMMIVETWCAPGQTLNELQTIWIPMAEILHATPQDQELQLLGDYPGVVRLQQIPGEWPENWVLYSLRLFREANPEESLVIDAMKIRQANPDMLSFGYAVPFPEAAQ